MKPNQCVFNFNNIKILNMTGNSSFNIGEINNKEFSNTNKFTGLNSTIGDNSESKSIMEISSFDPKEGKQFEDWMDDFEKLLYWEELTMSFSNIMNLQGIKVVNISGNASINPGSANISGNQINSKVVGVSFSIGDASISNSLNNNTYFDPDVSDQNSAASPATSTQV